MTCARTRWQSERQTLYPRNSSTPAPSWTTQFPLPSAMRDATSFAVPDCKLGFVRFQDVPDSEQMHLEFRSEFFNIWNHVNPVFEPVGLIGAEPQPLEFGTPRFGFPQGARDPRFIQFAMKFYF